MGSLSSEWKEVKLGDLVNSISERFDFDKEKLVLINTSDVLDGYVLNHIYVENKNIKGQFKKSFKKGDILYSEIRPKNRRFAYIDFNSENYVASTKLMVLRNKGLFIDNDYLFQILKSDEVINQLQNLAETRSGTFPQITYSELSIIKIMLPPLKEQKAIAHILSTLDEKIETNNQINKNLEEMAQEIFKHWFVDFEFPNENGEPYKSSGGEMVESELGMIPKGWEVGKLEGMINITSGKRPNNKSDFKSELSKIPLIGASKIMGYSDVYNFDEPVLIIGRVGTHGVVQRFNEKIWASDNTLVIRTEVYEYIYQILNQIDYTSLNVGSTQPLITQTDIKNLSIVFPKLDVLGDYEKLIGDLFNLHRNSILENEKLKKLRDTLLPKLMSGEIRVPLEEGDIS